MRNVCCDAPIWMIGIIHYFLSGNKLYISKVELWEIVCNMTLVLSHFIGEGGRLAVGCWGGGDGGMNSWLRREIWKIYSVASLGISCETALWWMLLDLTKYKSILVQVMAWCRHVTSHYQRQCWPRSMLRYCVTRPQWLELRLLNILCIFHDMPSGLYYKSHHITKLQCLSSRLWAIYWSQVLSREWRCSLSSTDRRCSNHIWVINSFIAY